MVDPQKALVLRHDGAGPRYTSYPTVPRWRDTVGWDAVVARVAALDGPLSVYAHVPFCHQQCLYCGCNMVVSQLQSAGDRYLDTVERQLATLEVPVGVTADRVHLGGGTPTWLSPEQLDRLLTLISTAVPFGPDTVLSVEAEPKSATDAHLDVLAAHGTQRLSIGVQSLDPGVQGLVERTVDVAQVARIVDGARERGIGRVNLDLMYGLPGQTTEGFARTLEAVIAMAPDRLAVFGYAHVPWMKAHQRKLPENRLPSPSERLDLYLLAHRMLTEAGMLAVGLDHFAVPGDPLVLARRDGVLARDFMGYTTRTGPMLGLGMSAISQFDDLYVQVAPGLAAWRRGIAGRDELVEKACLLTAEDRLRRDVIMGLMCNLVVRHADIEAKHDVIFTDHFAAELAQLAPMVEEGLVQLDADAVRVSEAGRLLVRKVAMAFDASLGRAEPAQRFSRLV